MKDFERIDRLERDFEWLLKSIYEAYNKLRKQAHEENNPIKNELLTASLPLGEILIRFSMFLKKDEEKRR